MYTLLTTQTHSAFVGLYSYSIWKLNISFISSYFKRVHVHLFSQKGYFVNIARENIEFIVLDAGIAIWKRNIQNHTPWFRVRWCWWQKWLYLNSGGTKHAIGFFKGKVKLRVIVDFTIYLIAQCNSHPHVAFCNRISVRYSLLRAVVGVVVILHNFTSLYSYGIHTYKRKHVAYNINK